MNSERISARITKRLMIMGVLTCFFIFAGIANALPIVTYDFTGTAGMGPSGNPLGLGIGDIGNTVSVSQDGLAVIITGKDTGPPGPSANLDRTAPAGLGVVDGGGFARIGFDEAVEFDFSPALVIGLSSIIFEVGNTSGSFDLFVDNLFAENVGWTSGGASSVFHSFATNKVGSVLELRGNTNSFRISELTVEVVPEPTTMLLFCSGLIGLAGFKRKLN